MFDTRGRSFDSDAPFGGGVPRSARLSFEFRVSSFEFARIDYLDFWPQVARLGTRSASDGALSSMRAIENPERSDGIPGSVMDNHGKGRPCSYFTYTIASSRSFSLQSFLLLPRSAHGLRSLLQQPLSLIVRVAFAFSAINTRSGSQFAVTTA